MRDTSNTPQSDQKNQEEKGNNKNMRKGNLPSLCGPSGCAGTGKTPISKKDSKSQRFQSRAFSFS